MKKSDNKLCGGFHVCYNCLNMVKNGSSHKCPKPESYEQMHKGIIKFLKEYKKFEEKSRKVRIIVK
jgi:GH25 family lysozyme M1 (1,4-beta-N-acetylmuramidase)